MTFYVYIHVHVYIVRYSLFCNYMFKYIITVFVGIYHVYIKCDNIVLNVHSSNTS